MSIRLSFELTDRDLDFFRDALRRCRGVVKEADERDIIGAVRSVIADIRGNEPLPDFVADRLPDIESMIDMLLDEEWQLPTEDREHLLSAFVYFGDPEDILADDVPVIGYLDDVIVVELIAQELVHAREAYNDFCRYRGNYDKAHPESNPTERSNYLDGKRRELHRDMLKQTAKDASQRLR